MTLEDTDKICDLAVTRMVGRYRLWLADHNVPIGLIATVTNLTQQELDAYGLKYTQLMLMSQAMLEPGKHNTFAFTPPGCDNVNEQYEILLRSLLHNSPILHMVIPTLERHSYCLLSALHNDPDISSNVKRGAEEFLNKVKEKIYLEVKKCEKTS